MFWTDILDILINLIHRNMSLKCLSYSFKVVYFCDTQRGWEIVNWDNLTYRYDLKHFSLTLEYYGLSTHVPLHLKEEPQLGTETLTGAKYLFLVIVAVITPGVKFEVVHIYIFSRYRWPDWVTFFSRPISKQKRDRIFHS